MEDNARSRVVTANAIRMCKELDLHVSVAEGIETKAQRDLLEALDCSMGQGYYFDRPMPIEVFEQKYVGNG